uniref:Uncharacterized protein n=1 Tax=Pararge aegeria TaxID=116150 RepID=S4NQX1_9NEOP
MRIKKHPDPHHGFVNGHGFLNNIFLSKFDLQKQKSTINYIKRRECVNNRGKKFNPAEKPRTYLSRTLSRPFLSGYLVYY